MKKIMKKLLAPLVGLTMALGVGLNSNKVTTAVDVKAALETVTISKANSTQYTTAINDGTVLTVGTGNNHIKHVPATQVNLTTTFFSNKSSTRSIFNNSAGEIRLYPGGGNGGELVFEVPTTHVFKKITVNSSQNPGLSINGTTTTLTSFTQDLSSSPINSISVKNIVDATSGSANQLRISSVEVEFDSATPSNVPVTDFDITTTPFTLYPGQTNQIEYTITPSNATNQLINWNSDNPTVASVDANGLVTANAAGVARITGTSADNILATDFVDVTVSAGTTYDYIYDSSWLYYGARYIIGASSHNVAMAPRTGTNDYYNPVATHYYNNALYAESTHQIVELERGTQAGRFSFKLVNGADANKYLGLTANANELRTYDTKQDGTDFDISFDTSGNANIAPTKYPDRVIRYLATSGSERFASYQGTQQPVQLYLFIDSVDETLTSDLSSIAITTQPNNKSYYAGQNFDPTGLVVTATYANNTTLDVTSGVTFDPSVMQIGTTQITVSYSERDITKTALITGITVQSDVLQSINIKTPTTKTTLSLGEALTAPGLVLNAVWSSGTKEVSEGFTLSGVDTMVLGSQTMTVTYNGKTTTYDVDVTNQGANAGYYQEIPGSSTTLYSGDGMWTTTPSNYGMDGTKYGQYNSAKLSSTDNATQNWFISWGNVGGFGSGITQTAGANIGYNSSNAGATIPSYITGNTSWYNDLQNIRFYLGMNFDVANPTSFEIKLMTEKSMDVYIVYSTNGGSSYSLLGDKQTTSISTGTSWDTISYNAFTSLGTSVRFGILLANSNTSKLRNRIGSIKITHDDSPQNVWVNGDFTPLEQATAFKNYVLDGVGLNVKDKGSTCYAALEELEAEYGYMSAPAKETFNTSSAEGFAEARARYTYLQTWVAANPLPPSPGGRPQVENKDNTTAATAAIGLIGLTSMLGYYFIVKRKKVA